MGLRPGCRSTATPAAHAGESCPTGTTYRRVGQTSLPAEGDDQASRHLSLRRRRLSAVVVNYGRSGRSCHYRGDRPGNPLAPLTTSGYRRGRSPRRCCGAPPPGPTPLGTWCVGPRVGPCAGRRGPWCRVARPPCPSPVPARCRVRERGPGGCYRSPPMRAARGPRSPGALDEAVVGEAPQGPVGGCAGDR